MLSTRFVLLAALAIVSNGAAYPLNLTALTQAVASPLPCSYFDLAGPTGSSPVPITAQGITPQGVLSSCPASDRVLVETRNFTTAAGHNIQISTKACSADVLATRSLEKRQTINVYSGGIAPTRSDCLNLQEEFPELIEEEGGNCFLSPRYMYFEFDSSDPTFFVLEPQFVQEFTLDTCLWTWVNENVVGGANLEYCFSGVASNGNFLNENCIGEGDSGGFITTTTNNAAQFWVQEITLNHVARVDGHLLNRKHYGVLDGLRERPESISRSPGCGMSLAATIQLCRKLIPMFDWKGLSASVQYNEMQGGVPQTCIGVRRYTVHATAMHGSCHGGARNLLSSASYRVPACSYLTHNHKNTRNLLTSPILVKTFDLAAQWSSFPAAYGRPHHMLRQFFLKHLCLRRCMPATLRLRLYQSWIRYPSSNLSLSLVGRQHKCKTYCEKYAGQKVPNVLCPFDCVYGDPARPIREMPRQMAERCQFQESAVFKAEDISIVPESVVTANLWRQIGGKAENQAVFANIDIISGDGCILSIRDHRHLLPMKGFPVKKLTCNPNCPPADRRMFENSEHNMGTTCLRVEEVKPQFGDTAAWKREQDPLKAEGRFPESGGAKPTVLDANSETPALRRKTGRRKARNYYLSSSNQPWE
ncbi:hypothetical protein B0H16DRAFT_1469664 [Mycena metata]|uniref:Uncharacterized protein n=1 Tax=Mycena metata TaxID=1033252 RepID=A0AAD7MRT6_9AGAR|nr:hypothetical protein B0H16DRAFT_1469664 [Mycena metata]